MRFVRAGLALFLCSGAACASLGKLAAAAAQAANQAAADNAPRGEVREESFYSSALGVRKHVAVYLPPSYAIDTAQRFPVVYYLHGLSGTETDWLSRGSIDVAADSLFARGTPEMIVVMPDADDGWYVNWVDPIPYATCADTTRSESPDRYCVARPQYEDYVAHDVVEFVDSRFRTHADRDYRGVAGLSMGGYGALILALKHPDVFGAAASHSGVVSPLYVGPHPFAAPPRYATTMQELRTAAGTYWSREVRYFGTDAERWRPQDPARVAESLTRRRGALPALWFDCGREDGFVDQNRALDWELTRLGITHRYAEYAGGHTWRYWSTHVRESLAWMGREIGR
jgi:putative tributyrin esterase